MPTPFNFEAPIPLVFGENRIDKLGRDVGRLAGNEARVVLVSDPGVAAAGLVDRARAVLEGSGAEVTVLPRCAATRWPAPSMRWST